MKIGIVGIGVVGKGVLEILKSNRDFQVKAICSRKTNEFPGAYYTDDYKKIVADEELDIVIETVGGIGVAKELITMALKAKKHVVTANKYLIAHHGKELFELAEANGVSLFYEASVAGGVPVLSPIKETLSHAEPKSVAGILNGTCNYILTKMRDEKLDFATALKAAQEAGYAEADPTFDIEGIDTSHKIMILTLLAFDRFIPVNSFKVKGISHIAYEDISAAEKMGYSIKLIGESVKVGDEKFAVSVEPMLVSHENLLSKIDSAINSVEVSTVFGGDYLFKGAGAGGLATAVSVVGDLYKIKSGTKWSYSGNRAEVVESSQADYFVKSTSFLEGIEVMRYEEIEGGHYSIIKAAELVKADSPLEKIIKTIKIKY